MGPWEGEPSLAPACRSRLVLTGRSVKYPCESDSASASRCCWICSFTTGHLQKTDVAGSLRLENCPLRVQHLRAGRAGHHLVVLRRRGAPAEEDPEGRFGRPGR